MNDILKQLKKQATVKEYSHGCWGETESYEVLDPDKFAELIIQQCCKEIKHKSIELLDVDFADHYILRLKKYYGVEE